MPFPYTHIAGPTSAVANRYVTSTNMVVGSYTLANTTPPTNGARKVTITHTAAGTVDTLGTVTVTGTDITGATISETITPLNGTTATGTLYFATITSIVGAGWVIAAGNDTITVGCAAPAILRQGSGVLKSVIINTTAASAITIADSTDTIAVIPASIAAGTAYNYDIVFTGYLSFTVAGASDITVAHGAPVGPTTAFLTRTRTG